ncbi:MAG: DNA recombination protein RmuC [Clostridia bacterium]
MNLTNILILITILLLFIILFKKNTNSKDFMKEFNLIRQELSTMLMQTREELTKTIGNQIVQSSTSQQLQLNSIAHLNEEKLENTRKNMEEKLESIRRTVENKLVILQRDNSEKLELMRVTVDEKLHNTLEKRLGESFKLVNDRLESVYKGLGEMRNLAQGVGDLKKVFTNVKTRGYWGEVQLNNILEQFLTKDQYSSNVKTRPYSNEIVEFAIKLPGKNDNEFVWLPVDSKFPIEDYSRLVDAEEIGDISLINEYRKKIEISIKLFAKNIFEKYVEAPHTTDFAIMFLPTESLYCEVLRNTGLCEFISQKYRIVVSGPSTFIALLNSLQMGFKTLAIEKRTSEVWQLLAIVKTEFSKFGDILDKTNKKLIEISSTMQQATKKTRTIESKLKNVITVSIDKENLTTNMNDMYLNEDNTV